VPVSTALHEKIDCLSRLTGRPEEESIAQAIQNGLAALHSKYVSEAYLDERRSTNPPAYLAL